MKHSREKSTKVSRGSARAKDTRKEVTSFRTLVRGPVTLNDWVVG